MKTLLIWDSFGEAELAFYVIEDAPEWLPKCHLQFVNAENDVWDLLNRVNDALCENPKHYGDPADALAGAWVGKRIDLEEAAIVDIGTVQIVVTGFIP